MCAYLAFTLYGCLRFDDIILMKIAAFLPHLCFHDLISKFVLRHSSQLTFIVNNLGISRLKYMKLEFFKNFFIFYFKFPRLFPGSPGFSARRCEYAANSGVW